MSTKMAPLDTDLVRNLVVRDLAKGYDGVNLVFDPIEVKHEIDWEGDEVLLIDVVFKGDQDLLDAHWSNGMVLRISPDLEKAGVTAFPMIQFIERSEWEQPVEPDW